MKRVLILVTLAALLAGGCSTSRYYPVRTKAEVKPIPVNRAPPRPPHEEFVRDNLHTRSREHYTLTHGQWVWISNGYRWQPSRWVEQPWDGAVWEPGHYDSRSRLWHPGYWR